MDPTPEQTAPRSTRLVRCHSKTRAGAPCPTIAMPGVDDLNCFAHTQDPGVRARRIAARTKGGVSRSNASRAYAIMQRGPYAEVADSVMKAIREVYDGDLDPARGSSIALLARSLVNVQDASVTESRIEALERQQDAGPASAPVFLLPDGTIRHEN
jgi:hypothetical protein